ncbi:MAG: hypothetical protein H7210_04815 [Pyrinomonadaceae bacterium]|nr:hypothetical protein [Phycisphaerales bacterium]
MLTKTHVSRASRAILAVSILFAFAGSRASAQWTLTILHPPASQASVGLAVFGGHQAGWVGIPGEHAGYWSGSSSSFVDLHPPTNSYISMVNALDNEHQCGFVYFEGAFGVNSQAMLWSGTEASHVNLHPAGALTSTATALYGNRQGGWSAPHNGPAHAGLWSGSAASWTDIHPAGWTNSSISSMYGDQQGGSVRSGAGAHACIWNGTAASFVDLHPAGASASQVIALSGTHQYGNATFGGQDRAGVWSGTAASWVDLHPPGALSSSVRGAFGNNQVGRVVDGAGPYPCIWSGTAESCTNLGVFLPAGAYTGANANGIWADLRFTYVVGEAFPVDPPPVGDPRQAIMWTRCNADVNGDAALTSSDFFDFLTAFFTSAPAADFNRDETITSQDFFDFIAAFFAGC